MPGAKPQPAAAPPPPPPPPPQSDGVAEAAYAPGAATAPEPAPAAASDAAAAPSKVKGKAADSWLKAQAEPEPAAELEPEPAPAADEDAPTRLLSIAGQPLEFAHARFGASRCEIRDVKAVAVDPIKADDFVQNVEQLNGNIAVAERGAITFVQKALKIQNAGAVAALFVNADDELFTLDGDEDDQVGATPSINLRTKPSHAQRVSAVCLFFAGRVHPDHVRAGAGRLEPAHPPGLRRVARGSAALQSPGALRRRRGRRNPVRGCEQEERADGRRGAGRAVWLESAKFELPVESWCFGPKTQLLSVSPTLLTTRFERPQHAREGWRVSSHTRGFRVEAQPRSSAKRPPPKQAGARRGP